MKECSATANRVLSNYVCWISFQVVEGSSHGAAKPNASMTKGAGRPKWAWQGGSGGPGANTGMGPQLYSFPGPTSTSHLNARTVQALEGVQSSLLMHAVTANITAGFAKACELIFYLQKTNTGQTKGSPSFLFFSQGSYTSLQSLLVSSQLSVHEVLTNYLIVLPLRHTTSFASAFVAFDISCPP